MSHLFYCWYFLSLLLLFYLFSILHNFKVSFINSFISWSAMTAESFFAYLILFIVCPTLWILCYRTPWFCQFSLISIKFYSNWKLNNQHITGYCVRLCLGKRLFHVTLTPREYFLFLGHGLILVSMKGSEYFPKAVHYACTISKTSALLYNFPISVIC